MALKSGESVHLDAFCPSCEASYYRTARPLVVGRDKLTPDLFVPIKTGTPPPNPDKPECPTCSSPLRFIAAAKEPVNASPPEPSNSARENLDQVMRDAERPSRPVENPVHRAAAVDTLFAVAPDEQIVDIKDAGGAYLVVTNRRIVKVSYE